MKNIRVGVFETNSSSTHSIHIASDSSGVYETIVPNDDGIIELTGGEFGWEWRKFNDALTKANYVAVYLSRIGDEEMKNMFINVVKSHTGAKDIVFKFHTDYDNMKNTFLSVLNSYGVKLVDSDDDEESISYIDHQSIENESCRAVFESKDAMKRFLFSDKSFLFLGNDNESPPAGFYDR